MLTAHQLAPQHIPRAGSRRRRSIPHFRGTVHVAAPDPMSMILYVCYCVCLDEVCFLRYPSTVTMGRTDVVCCTVAFLNGATAHAPTHGPATPTRAGQSAVGRGAVARSRAGRVSSGEDHDRATEDDRLEVERVGGEEQEGRVDCVPVAGSWENLGSRVSSGQVVRTPTPGAAGGALAARRTVRQCGPHPQPARP